MSSESMPDSAPRIVRVLLLVVGALMVVYAISDHPLYGGGPGFGWSQTLVAAAGVGLALCGLLPTSIAARILLLTVTGLVMLGVAEIAGEVVLGPRHRPIYQPDDRLIFKFIPNRRSAMTRIPLNGGEKVIHRINSGGFRGDELQPTGEAMRVVVYGDSFIHAYYSPDEETFAARLGALLRARLGKEIEVVNAGVSSYGPDQISMKMESELPRLRPDLVVVAIFAGNDYGDLLRHKMFRLGADGALVANHWILDPKARMLLELAQKESILKRALRNVVYSWRASLGRLDNADKPGQGTGAIDIDFLLAEAEREYRSFVVENNDIITNTHVGYYSADVSFTPGSASARYRIALMEALVRRIRDVAAQNRVPLAFLFIPHPSDVIDHYDGWRIDRKRFPEYHGRNQIAPLEGMARALGVPFVSLYDVYRANDANLLYFHGGDDHWNAAGQRIAANVMAAYLLAHGLPGTGRAAASVPGHEKSAR